jgi:hypothetical protein
MNTIYVQSWGGIFLKCISQDEVKTILNLMFLIFWFPSILMNKKLLIILKYDNLKHHIFIRNVLYACVHLHGEIIGFKLNFKNAKKWQCDIIFYTPYKKSWTFGGSHLKW